MKEKNQCILHTVYYSSRSYCLIILLSMPSSFIYLMHSPKNRISSLLRKQQFSCELLFTIVNNTIVHVDHSIKIIYFVLNPPHISIVRFQSFLLSPKRITLSNHFLMSSNVPLTISCNFSESFLEENKSIKNLNPDVRAWT